MKSQLIFLATCLLGLFLFWTQSGQAVKQLHPQPTNNTIVKMDMEDGSRSGRMEWINSMHRAAPDVNWRDIEYQNAKQSAKEKVALRNQVANRDPGVEQTIVDDHLAGIWYERGSSSQAGSVIALEYVKELDAIFLISAGGSLWQGKRDGSEWVVLNQDLIFSNRFFEVLPYQGGYRMISAIEGRVHYSDDMGATWESSQGMINPHDGWRLRHPIVIENDAGDHELFVFYRDGWWSDARLYRSVDYGMNFEEITKFNTSNLNNFALSNPHGTEDVYLIEQISSTASKLHKWDTVMSNFELINADSPFSFKNGRGNLAGAMYDTELRLFSYRIIEDDPKSIYQLFVTKDLGASWQELKVFAERPWDVGVYISPSEPENMFTGGVNGFRSHDAGASFILKNEWFEYYDFVETKLHADIMYYEEFEDPDGNPFLLNANHGGLYISTDHGRNYQNISLDGLNIAQYYSVRSHPSVPDYVYAGAQDQGFQRGLLNSDNTASPLEQVISGDYGHIVFSESGNRLWTVYPGGWVTYYADPLQGGVTTSYEIKSPDESVWIPPMMSHPDETKNIAYIAGGNIDNLPGYHIIEMEAITNPQGADIEVRALPFDFITYGAISAMEVNPMNHDQWYVATESGRFLYSDDGGQNFTAAFGSGPGGHYLYGSDILASKLVDQTVYLCGSGYSNSAVVKSIDGGQTFQAMTNGLPKTMVFSIAANDDESLIFAATEAGPYVYITALDEWYNLSGITAPLQTYWSVEYIPSLKIARFGTYGRGIWDFEVTGTSSDEETLVGDGVLQLFPNPTSDYLRLSGINENGTVTILGTTGRIIKQEKYSPGNGKIDVSELPQGNYFITFRSENINEIKQFIKVN